MQDLDAAPSSLALRHRRQNDHVVAAFEKSGMG